MAFSTQISRTCQEISGFQKMASSTPRAAAGVMTGCGDEPIPSPSGATASVEATTGGPEAPPVEVQTTIPGTPPAESGHPSLPLGSRWRSTILTRMPVLGRRPAGRPR